MLRYKHLRLDQEKLEKAKKIFRAKTETEAMDRALENVIKGDQELLRRRGLMKRILELRKSLGKTREDSAEWIRLARQERNQSLWSKNYLMPSRIVFPGLDGSVITALFSNCFLTSIFVIFLWPAFSSLVLPSLVTQDWWVADQFQ